MQDSEEKPHLSKHCVLAENKKDFSLFWQKKEGDFDNYCHHSRHFLLFRVNHKWKTKKPVPVWSRFFCFGGRERIRTAVQGFADLCLATRPPDPVVVSLTGTQI